MLDVYRILAQWQVPEKYYLLKLEKLLQRSADGNASPKAMFGDVSDDYWLWLNTEGYRASPQLQGILPGLPEQSVQLQSNGISGDVALVDGFIVYRWVKEIYESYSSLLSRCNSILDFGCGWGRVTRYFLKDLDPPKIWGIDHYPKVLEICKETNRWCNFNLVDSFPPTTFSDNTFDLIFCYSVFSHLSEEAHQQWLREFRRILRPGGMLLATTWERDFILRCAQTRENPNLPFFQKHLPTIFVNTDQVLADYDQGKFCFESSVESYGASSSFQGEACIPPGYVRDNWTKYFTFLDFISDPTMCSQNVIVVRRAFDR